MNAHNFSSDLRPAGQLAKLLALIFVVSLPSTVVAADAAQESAWNERLQRAEALQSDAHQRQAAADAEYAEVEKACFSKFLVNRCRDQAKKVLVGKTREARRLDNEGKALERAVRQEQVADKDRQRAEREPVRQAEQAEHTRQSLEARSEAERERETKLADKERQAEEGAKKRAAESERQQKKRAEHEAKVAAKIAAAERKAAEKAAGKAAGD